MIGLIILIFNHKNLIFILYQLTAKSIKPLKILYFFFLYQLLFFRLSYLRQYYKIKLALSKVSFHILQDAWLKSAILREVLYQLHKKMPPLCI